MSEWLRHIFRGRPWWMNVLMVFSGYMAFVYVPWDFFLKPVAEDQEVWFGVTFSGWGAKLTEPLHFAVYAAGAYGFHRMRPWMWPWASVYTAQVAFGMLVWSVVEHGGFLGWVLGLVPAVLIGGLAWLLWDSREVFQPSERRSLRERYGEWAVVTGASAGIGAAFARALAREGLSVVLTARREDRLRALADELEKDHHVATRVVAVDLAQEEGAARLLDALTDLEVAVLVNNAGFGYAGRFDKLDAGRLRELVHLNCTAPMLLTHALLPGMRRRGRGAVIVVGSVAGRQPLPLHGVYAASKSFDLLFGEALWAEQRDEGVDVLVLEPGATETEFQEVAGEVTHPGEPPEKVVRTALEALGRQPSVVSGWWNWLRANLATRLLPRSLVALVARDVVEQQTPESMR